MKYSCRCILLFLFFLSGINLLGQSIPFQLGYNGGADDFFKSIVECADGGFIAVGATKSFGAGNNDVLIVRTDRNGNVRWSRTIGTTGNDIGNGVALVDDHGFMIVGSTNFYHNGNDDALIIRTDSNGVVLWSKTYGDTLPDIAEYIMRTSDGKYIVGGSSYDSIAYVSQDALQMKIDSLGNVVWERIVGASFYESYYSSVELPGGNLVNVGFTDNGVSGGVMEKVASNGTSIWRKKFGGNGNDFFYDVALGLNGKLMAVGTTASFGAGGYDVLLVAVDSIPTSASVVSRTAGTSGTEFAYAIFATADTGFIVSGMTNGYSTNGTYDPFVMKINSAGLIQWTKIYGTTYADAISSGIISSDGHYVFAGYSYGLSVGNNMAGFLIKTDTTGDGGCNTNAVAFSQTINGAMQTFGMSDSFPALGLVPRILISVPINSLQLNPLCLNGIVSSYQEMEMNLFPNPSNGKFTLTINFPTDKNLQMDIYDLNARILFNRKNLTEGENEIDVTDLPSGVYFLSLKNGNEIIKRTKLIVTH